MSERRGRRAIVALALAFMALALTPAESAAEVVWAILEGYSEVPAISTVGNGAFRGVISDDGASISFLLAYFDLPTAVSAAHIHLGQPGVNGSIAAFLCGGGGQPACGASPAQLTGVITAASVQAIASQGLAAGDLAALIRAIRRGAAYVNVHTSAFGGGEIRGQINP